MIHGGVVGAAKDTITAVSINRRWLPIGHGVGCNCSMFITLVRHLAHALQEFRHSLGGELSISIVLTLFLGGEFSISIVGMKFRFLSSSWCSEMD